MAPRPEGRVTAAWIGRGVVDLPPGDLEGRPEVAPRLAVAGGKWLP